MIKDLQRRLSESLAREALCLLIGGFSCQSLAQQSRRSKLLKERDLEIKLEIKSGATSVEKASEPPRPGDVYGKLQGKGAERIAIHEMQKEGLPPMTDRALIKFRIELFGGMPEVVDVRNRCLA